MYSLLAVIFFLFLIILQIKLAGLVILTAIIMFLVNRAIDNLGFNHYVIYIQDNIFPFPYILYFNNVCYNCLKKGSTLIFVRIVKWRISRMKKTEMILPAVDKKELATILSMINKR
jgi:hypothetical protein